MLGSETKAFHSRTEAEAIRTPITAGSDDLNLVPIALDELADDPYTEVKGVPRLVWSGVEHDADRSVARRPRRFPVARINSGHEENTGHVIAVLYRSCDSLCVEDAGKAEAIGRVGKGRKWPCLEEGRFEILYEIELSRGAIEPKEQIGRRPIGAEQGALVGASISSPEARR